MGVNACSCGDYDDLTDDKGNCPKGMKKKTGTGKHVKSPLFKGFSCTCDPNLTQIKQLTAYFSGV